MHCRHRTAAVDMLSSVGLVICDAILRWREGLVPRPKVGVGTCESEWSSAGSWGRSIPGPYLSSETGHEYTAGSIAISLIIYIGLELLQDEVPWPCSGINTALSSECSQCTAKYW